MNLFQSPQILQTDVSTFLVMVEGYVGKKFEYAFPGPWHQNILFQVYYQVVQFIHKNQF